MFVGFCAVATLSAPRQQWLDVGWVIYIIYICIISNVNCIIIPLIDSVSGPLCVALNLGVWIWSRRADHAPAPAWPALVLNYQLQLKETVLIQIIITV